MAAHRYWRAAAFEAYGADELELSCFYLLSAGGSRIDDAALLASSVPPASGALAALQDSDLTTGARWVGKSAPDLTLTWDFGGAPAEVADIKLAGNSHARFPLILNFSWSDDAMTWTQVESLAGIAWPGQNAFTASDSPVTHLSLSASANYLYEETSGAIVTDASTFSRHGAYVGSVLPSIPALLSRGARAFGTTDLQYHTAPSAVFSGVGAFSVSAIVQYTTTNNTVVLERGGNSLSIQTLGSANLSAAPGAVPGTIALVCGGNPAYAVVYSNISLADGLPHFVQLIYSPVIAERYCIVDGVDRTARGPVNAVPVSDSSDWQIGSRSGVAGYGGRIDELAFFQRALTQQEGFGLYSWIAQKFLIKRNRVLGRAASSNIATLGAGPALTYGIPTLHNLVKIGVESGGVKDLITGMLGKGIGRISGTVKNTGTPDVPVYRKVRLIRERDGVLIREIWSHPVTGAYSFDFVDELQTWTVLSYDHTLLYNAVIGSGLAAEVIA